MMLWPFQRLRSWMHQAPFRRGVFTLAGGTALSQAIVVVASPLLTRLYTPADLGTYSGALALVALVATISTLGYRHAIVIPESRVEASNLLALSILVTLSMTLFMAVGLAVAGEALLAPFGAGSVGLAVLLLPATQLTLTVNDVLKLWMLRTKRFTRIAVAGVAQGATTVVTQTAMGLIALGSGGLLAGHITGSLAAIATLVRGAAHRQRETQRTWSVRGIAEVASSYRRFAFLGTPSQFLNTLGLRAPLLIMLALYGAESGGQFALAERVTALPVLLVARSVGQVFQAHAAPLARADPAGLRRMFAGTVRSSAIRAVAPAAAGMVAAPFVFPAVFGSAWSDAGLYAAAMVPWYYATTIVNPTNSVVHILKRQDLALLRELLRLALYGLVIGVAAITDATPLTCVAMLSATGVAAYAAFAAISWHAIRRSEPRAQAQPIREED